MYRVIFFYQGWYIHGKAGRYALPAKPGICDYHVNMQFITPLNISTMQFDAKNIDRRLC